jgi:predicted enzyme related to lactoylglutathione lyase
LQWDVPGKVQEPSPVLRSVPTLEVEKPPQPEPQPYARREITLVPEPAPLKVAATKPAETFATRTPRLEVEKVAPPTRVPKLPAGSQIVWFDIPVRDIDRAIRFYSAVLGTELTKQQAAPGTAIVVLPYGEGSIGGSLVQTMDAKPSDKGPLLYLNTNERLEEALKEVEKNGGKVLAEMHSIAPFGFRAIVLDSEGNRIALHSM